MITEIRVEGGTTTPHNKDQEISRLKKKLQDFERQEEELRESQRLLTETQRVAGLGTYVLDFEKGNWTSSPILDQLFGIDESFDHNISGWLEVVHPEWRAKMEEYYAVNIMTRRERFDIEYKIIRQSDQEERWVHGLGELLEDQDGNLYKMVGTIQDVTDRKRTEIALQESEQKYRTLAEQIFDVLYRTDISGRIQYISPSSLETFGYTPEEMIGRSITEFLEESAIPEAMELLGSALSKQEPVVSARFELRKKNGTRFIGEISGATVVEDGQLMGTLGLIRDVTVRESAAEVTRKNEERLKNLLELNQAPARDEDELLSNGLTFGIRQTGSASGFLMVLDDPPDKLPQKVLTLIPSSAKGVFTLHTTTKFKPVEKAALEQLVRDKVFIDNCVDVDSEVRKAMLPGLPSISRILAVPIMQRGKAVGLVGVMNKEREYDKTDVLQLTLLMDNVWKIRERWLAEQELRKTTEELDRYFTNSLDLLCIADDEGRFVRLNPEWENTLGYKLDELIGRKFMDFVHPQDIQSTLDAGTSLAEGSPVINFANRYRCKDGSLKWLEWRSFPVDGQIYAVARDMTQHYQLEAQLRQSQKLDAVGRLAGGIAHDFNNMLGVILGLVELAMLKIDKENDLYQDMKQIEHAAERSADLTRQLLAFSRKQIIEPQVIDLNESLDTQMNMMRRFIGEDVQITLSTNEGACLVRIDPSQFDQLLVNLAANARDAIEGNGEIHIDTSIVNARDVAPSPEQGRRFKKYVKLAFSDTGSGIEPENLEKIFDPFFTTKPNGRGTGLGLATLYGIVTQNDGWIQVDSEVGKGTTFTIYLPHSEKSIIAKKQTKGKNSEGRGETILVVEDEIQILGIAERLLTKNGYNVLTAEHPMKALEILEDSELKVDLLLSDMILPEMNGRDLSDQIRQSRPDIVTVFMSGYTADMIATRGIKDGGLHFIQKPFTSISLLQKVREALDLAHLMKN